MLNFCRQGSAFRSQLTLHIVVIQWQSKVWQDTSDYELNPSPNEGKSRVFLVGFTAFWIYPFYGFEQFIYTICLTSHYVEFVNCVPKSPWLPMWMLCWGSLQYKRQNNKKTPKYQPNHSYRRLDGKLTFICNLHCI